jgi:hypothetical protein
MHEILDTKSSDWDKYLSFMRNPKLEDIYYTQEYYKLYENNGDGAGRCFIYRRDDKMVMYPFMINEIRGYKLDKTYYDIETAYGYGGPISNSDDKAFLKEFEKAFIEYCEASNIVAEFIRFHPLMRNETIFNKDIEVLHNRTTVYLDLASGVGSIWENHIKSKDRNMIRKAEKNGLRVVKGSDFDAFKEIYEETMDKVQAGNYYYFNDEYYNTIKKNKSYILLNVIKDDMVIASAIFMHFGEYFHYHLAGSKKEYLKYAPNNLLLWEAIKLACETSAAMFHFGGGLTNSLEDPLFKFKSSFSKTYSNYYIGKRVHNTEVYNYLINEWEKNNAKKAKILLQYKF